jgi:UDP-N-acetylmuramyl pentapeptide phosphotransferase/UDP-N-acetylglucosamine-1-phosphate transferase
MGSTSLDTSEQNPPVLSFLTLFGVSATGSFLLSLLMCSLLRRFAIRHSLVDIPNARSLHQLPVPRLGGVALTGATWLMIGVQIFAAPQSLARDLLLWLLASVPIAGVGLFDDVRSLRADVRFLVQLTIAAAFSVAIGIPARLAITADHTIYLGRTVATLLSSIWIVGVLNIYNFMDGMDGLAGSQAFAASLAVAAGLAIHGQLDLALVAGLVAAATAAFNINNFPPAKIFLGDAGSTFLGFSFAAMSLMGVSRIDPLPFVVVPLALSPFLLDGTFTILRRISRREPIWKAHKSHLYQRAVAAGLSHHDVLLPYAAWIAAAAGSACVAARANSVLAVLLASAMLLALAAMWRWVVVLERAHVSE